MKSVPFATSRSLGSSRLRVSPLGLGLAAVARPGYITLGRDRDLPGERSAEVLYERCAALLDCARELEISYVDVARSYGRAEEFLARWLESRDVARDSVRIGSKWGYEYTANWQVEAEVHEQKELTVTRFQRQLEESRALLGNRIDLYQIHSATLESGVLDDDGLMTALVDARRRSLVGSIGLTLSGPRSEETLRRAMEVDVGGERVFDVVQATCNILEPSIAPTLGRAKDLGMGVIAKEIHANGRLTPANRRPEDHALVEGLSAIAARHGLGLDQLAVAFVSGLPCVDVVNSGAATVEQLRSHAAGLRRLQGGVMRELRAFAEEREAYWATRGSLPWN